MLLELAPSHAEGCLDVIRSLPEWFGYPGALEGVASALESQDGFAVVEDGVVAGFVLLQRAYDESLEITYLAVRLDRHRGGLGRSLLHAVGERAIREGIASVCLLTLGPSSGSLGYAETVAFYVSMGFWRVKELYLSAWQGAPTLLMAAPASQLLQP
jgi:N-acetylglutamate synthase-like GNAT family acetyltransferase